MKKLANAAWLLMLAACATKDPVQPTDPDKSDISKIEISVYDATKWATDKPYGELRAGVTVNLYTSQSNLASQRIAYSTVTDANGKAIFQGLPSTNYFIEAKVEDLSNMPGRNNYNKGYRYDSIYQVYSPARANELFPYPGNFIYKDINGDNKLDDNDMVPLPADQISSDTGKTNKIRILIGKDDNVNNRPFANAQAAKDALNNLYDEVHTWHQQEAIIDAVVTDNASCTGLPDYCELDRYQFGSSNTYIQSLWTNAINIINKANRLITYGYKVTGDSTLVGEAAGVQTYVRMQLTDLFGTAPYYTSLVPPANLKLEGTDAARIHIDQDFVGLMHLLPNLTRANTNRSHLSQEAVYAFIIRNSNHFNTPMATESSFGYIHLPLFDNDSAVVLEDNRMNSYTTNNSREIIWGDTRPISNPDLKVKFRKGIYLPIMNLNQVITIRAEQRARRGSPVNAIGYVMLIASRSNLPGYYNPNATLQDALNIIHLQSLADQGIEGNTLNNLVRWGRQMTDLGPLGFKPHNEKLPIPLSFLKSYPNVGQNPGY